MAHILEIHVWSPRDGFKYFMEWWELLERFGLRPFWFEPNLVYVNSLHARPDAVEVSSDCVFSVLYMDLTNTQYAFINVKGDHMLISD